MFILIVVVLTLVYIIVSDEISLLITALFSFNTTLLVLYSGGSDCDGLLVILNIKPNVYNLGNYGFGVCNLSI